MASRVSSALRQVICSRFPLARSFQSQSLQNGALESHSNLGDNSSKTKVSVPKHFVNRNPRSLEYLGVAPKPKGFKTRKQKVDYYYRLVLDISTRHVSAYVEHNSGVRVVEASTKEFCIARHLYKTCDVSAAHNVGRVLAHRMCQIGLTRVMWEELYWTRKHMKVVAFLKGIKGASILLNEPKVRKTLPSPSSPPSPPPSYRPEESRQTL